MTSVTHGYDREETERRRIEAAETRGLLRLMASAVVGLSLVSALDVPQYVASYVLGG